MDPQPTEHQTPASHEEVDPPLSSSLEEEKGSKDSLLIWSDEFDGEALDMSKWTYEVNGDGGGNNELQFYTDHPSNGFVRDGKLHIVARREDFNGKAYTSARINTAGKFSFTHGRIDVRAKLPKGRGIWPAVWLLPQDWKFGGWPQSGEIDLLEIIGSEPNRLHGTLHYGDPWPNNKRIGVSTAISGSLSDDFHVFSLVWAPKRISWQLDGHEFGAFVPRDLELGGRSLWPFEEKFHLIVNLAVGGNWPGSPDESTEFPQELLIDYIRVCKLREEERSRERHGGGGLLHSMFRFAKKDHHHHHHLRDRFCVTS